MDYGEIKKPGFSGLNGLRGNTDSSSEIKRALISRLFQISSHPLIQKIVVYCFRKVSPSPILL
jgi:hypothetical protein